VYAKNRIIILKKYNNLIFEKHLEIATIKLKAYVNNALNIEILY
jgi:hypothetical protein